MFDEMGDISIPSCFHLFFFKKLDFGLLKY
jgi:hypothetical protein